MKNIIYSLFIMLVCSNFAFAMNFVDVPQGFWAYEEINQLTNDGIISGKSINYYKPKMYVTRAEYAAMVIKAIEQENIPVENIYSFNDINYKHWAWKYITRAIELDILKPVSKNYFYPNDYVTRSEIIKFLVNILKSEDITKKEAILALQESYNDFEDIPDWFKYTAGKAEVLDVIAKEPPRERYLDYDAYITRAQMAVFLYNLKEKLNSYIIEQKIAASTPKTGDGLIIENVLYMDDVATLPRGTVLPIMIVGKLSSKDSQPGDMFQARFANNIIDYDHYVILSKDIVLIGKVLDTTKAIGLVRNGELLFEISAANKNGNLTRILAAAECETPKTEANKFKKSVQTVAKGRNFVAKDGQIIYIKLFKPMRINIVTGEILD